MWSRRDFKLLRVRVPRGKSRVCSWTRAAWSERIQTGSRPPPLHSHPSRFWSLLWRQTWWQQTSPGSTVMSCMGLWVGLDHTLTPCMQYQKTWGSESQHTFWGLGHMQKKALVNVRSQKHIKLTSQSEEYNLSIIHQPNYLITRWTQTKRQNNHNLERVFKL